MIRATPIGWEVRCAVPGCEAMHEAPEGYYNDQELYALGWTEMHGPDQMPGQNVCPAHNPFHEHPEGVAAALALCDQVEANPLGWGGDVAVSLARSVRNALGGAS